VFERFEVERFYYDPPGWHTEGEQWALRHGERIVLPWETYRTKAMHAALERFVIDLRTKAIRTTPAPSLSVTSPTP
jgi:hypothetical protein